MKSDLNQAMSDINAWRAKFEALERTKNREIDEIKSSFENNKRYEIERELKESQSRYQNEKALFDMELKRSKDLLDSKNKEI